MSKIRGAVIGAGEFGRHHARVLHELPEAELVAVADSDPARARDTAARFGVAALTNYRDLAGRIDAAAVAPPAAVHAELGARLLSGGLDVLVAKPIAADLASAVRRVAAARDHGRALRVGPLERFRPAVEAAAALARL